MEIEFELLEEDYVNFNIEHANSSVSVKRSLILQRTLGPFVFLIFIEGIFLGLDYVLSC